MLNSALLRGFAACAVIGLAMTASALTLDGVVSDLGTAYGTDPTGGWTTAGDEGGNGNNPNIDLSAIYVKDDGAGNVFFGLTVATPITAGSNDWGKYKIWIQTNNGGAGAPATSDPWGRTVNYGTFSPNYCISCYIDGAGGANLHHWNSGTSSWDQLADPLFARSFNGNGGNAGIEFSVPRATLGNAQTVKVIGGTTGGGGSDSIQDSVSDVAQPNNNSWSSAVTFNAPSSNATVPVTVSAFSVE